VTKHRCRDHIERHETIGEAGKKVRVSPSARDHCLSASSDLHPSGASLMIQTFIAPASEMKSSSPCSHNDIANPCFFATLTVPAQTYQYPS